ncbi:MAG: hypothetical protein CMJ25_04770 [Phycisphaerae bacterium]|jgi:hypothetical protein|nr:hypothetical protein [Phycisphaerae bacterium]|tara:strand:+ start:90 stop:530 length:441 start_codon:yes stop_codon:yes gene_type:complete
MNSSVRKPFEPHLYDRFDNPAKVRLIEVLEREGHEISSVKENYYADVESTKDGVTYYSEAEVKRGWVEAWPATWAEIRIPDRKTRLLKKYDYKVNFFVFNNDLTSCWKILGSQMTDDTIREARGRRIMKGEKFFHIPYGEAELIVL